MPASIDDRGDASAHREDDPQQLVASARALLQEISEEGVEQFEALAFETDGPAQAAPAAAHQAAAHKQPAAPDQPATPQPSAPATATRAESAPSATRSTASSVATTQEPPRVVRNSITDASVPWAGRRPTLDEVQSHLGDCDRCGLAGGRHSIVFGSGNPDAKLMFIGEAPGEQEDRQGLPFVGRAGDLLTQMIEKGIGIPRSDVYICNIIKCRPPQNRNPLPPEVSACNPFLEGQIAAIAPSVIVTLGKPAAGLLLGREVAITRLRGTWQDWNGIPLMPTLHPAYVLRQYTPENRRAVWEDLRAAAERSQTAS